MENKTELSFIYKLFPFVSFDSEISDNEVFFDLFCKSRT